MAPGHTKRLRVDKKADESKSVGRKSKRAEAEAKHTMDNSDESMAGAAAKDEIKSEYSGSDGEGELQAKRTKDKEAKDTRMKAAANNSLFIRSLAYTTTPESLTTHFSFIAPVKHAHIVLDPVTKQSKGFGFVTFAEAEDAVKAVEEFDGKEFEGRRLKVEIAQTRHRAGDGLEGAEAAGDGIKKGKEEVEKRNPRLIIRNLPWVIKKPDQLYDVFKKYGKVKDVIIPLKKGAPPGSGLLAGFAFITMKRYRHAQKAIEEVNGTFLSGRTVAVDWAVEKDKWHQLRTEGRNVEIEISSDEDDDSSDDDEGVEIKEEPKDEDGIDEHIDNTSDRSDEDEDEDEDEDDFDEDLSDDEDGEKIEHNNSLSLFLRNVPFSVTDKSLHAHFQTGFGPVRYARIVMDYETQRPRGTAFVAFYNEEHYTECLRNAPRPPPPGTKPSLLQSESQDPDGKYTIDGRVLIVTKAVDKNEASKLAELSSTVREGIMNDKRRVYLLAEGNIPSNSPMYKKLSPSERAMREASIKQRRQLIKSNPSLHLSLTRLSIRNLPRSITAKDLKLLAREAVVGFSADVRNGKRAALSKEELNRGGDEDKDAELERRKKGKGVVRQVKIIEEKTNGRSRGYGFIEYVSHRWALMGLRWLNGREVGGGLEIPVADIPGRRERIAENSKHHAPKAPEAPQQLGLLKEQKKRLIIEFALENANVVRRRKETEKKWRDIARDRAKTSGATAPNGKGKHDQKSKGEKERPRGGRDKGKPGSKGGDAAGKKRKRSEGRQDGPEKKKVAVEVKKVKKGPKSEEESKQAMANRLIARKRQQRRGKL